MTGGDPRNKYSTQSPVQLGYCVIGGENTVNQLTKNTPLIPVLFFKQSLSTNASHLSGKLAHIKLGLQPLPSSAILSGNKSDLPGTSKTSRRPALLSRSCNPTTKILPYHPNHDNHEINYCASQEERGMDKDCSGYEVASPHLRFSLHDFPQNLYQRLEKNGDLHPSSSASLWTATIKVLGCPFFLQVQIAMPLKGILKNDMKDLKVGGEN